MRISQIKNNFPLSVKSGLSICVLLVILIIGYKVKLGLTIFCVLMSAVSDALWIVMLRDVLNRSMPKEYITARKAHFAIFLLVSLSLHIVSFILLGIYSFILVLPTLGLLVIIYTINRFVIK